MTDGQAGTHPPAPTGGQGELDEWRFDCGVAISVYQNSGGSNTQWETFERQKRWFGRPAIKNGVNCGNAADFWNRYEEDIQRAAELHSTTFRLSLEWSRIEPSQGSIDSHGISRYHQILDCIRKHGMQPNVTLHHFVHPQWFEDKGAFTDETNIKYFVDFCCLAYREFGSKVQLWSTFNEPGVMGFCGWIYGAFPPAKLGAFREAGEHLWNLLQAHKAAYRAIKALPGGSKARIGIVHNYLRYEAVGGAVSRAYTGPLTRWLNSIWCNDLMLDYFRTGKFHWAVPFGSPIQHDDEEPPPLDWFGINYYSRVCINWKFQPTGRPGETMTDMPFPLYGPGIYEGLRKYSAIGVPMYITETGIPDYKEDRREEMFNTYFPQIERAVREGIDVRGVMYWTLVDNFEWAEGWTIKFGLYAFDPARSQQRIQRFTTPTLAKIFEEFPQRIQAARKHALMNSNGASSASDEDPPAEKQLL